MQTTANAALILIQPVAITLCTSSCQCYSSTKTQSVSWRVCAYPPFSATSLAFHRAAIY